MASNGQEIDRWAKTLPKNLLSSQTLDFIDKEIKFITDDGKTLYLHIRSKELIEDQFGNEIRIQFAVESESAKQRESREEKGDQRTWGAVLWYTLSGDLSFEENRESLRDFVLSHYRQAAIPPKIRKNRPSDSRQ